MKSIAITIEGVTPLLMNRFTDAAQIAASSGSTGTFSNDSQLPRDQAEGSLYTDEEGRIGIPGPNLFRCIMDAGKYFKIGRSKVTTQKSSYIPGAAWMDELFILLPDPDWKVDTRPIRNPATGGRVLRHRPCFDRWSLSFNVQLDESIISPQLFRDIVDAAGQRIGLGDFRPDTKGPFGRFKVTRWEVTNGDDS